MSPAQDPKSPAKQITPQPGERQALVFEAASFVGPLPPPVILRGYEEACPGAASRIIAMAEQQGLHRRGMEREALELQRQAMQKRFLEARIGQACAFSIALSFIAGGVYVIINGHVWAGAAVCGGGVGLHALVSAFLPRPQPAANAESGAPKPKGKLPKNQK